MTRFRNSIARRSGVDPNPELGIGSFNRALSCGYCDRVPLTRSASFESTAVASSSIGSGLTVLGFMTGFD